MLYCNNDPISYTDESGEGIIAIIAVLVVCAVIGGTIGGVVSYNKGNTGWDLAKDIILGTAMGFAGGGLSLAVGGAAVTVFAHGVKTVLGVASIRVAAIGILSHNLAATLIAPLYGIKMNIIEFQAPQDNTTPTDVKILTE